MARSAVTTEERRGLPLVDARIQLRADDEVSDERFVGHAAVFNVRTAIGNPMRWGFYEEIAPGAFTKTLSEGDARFLLDHDSYYVVSRVSAGTLSLRQDAIGLAVDSALDLQLSYVGDLKANVRNGNITGMSFGFYVVKDQWSTEEIEVAGADPIEVEIRRILEVRLIEVSAVTFPAYEETDAGLRAALRHRGDPDAIRRRLDARPELATLLDELSPAARVQPALVVDTPDDVQSRQEEPAETTPQDDTEPAASTRIAPSQHDLAKARLRALQPSLRRRAS